MRDCAPREQMDISVARYSEIIKAVWDLLNISKVHWEDVLNTDNSDHNYKALNDKLEEILSSVQDYPSNDLVGWVRYSSSRNEHLPAWQPLCDAAIAQCIERNSIEYTQRLFFGLMPETKRYQQGNNNG